MAFYELRMSNGEVYVASSEAVDKIVKGQYPPGGAPMFLYLEATTSKATGRKPASVNFSQVVAHFGPFEAGETELV